MKIRPLILAMLLPAASFAATAVDSTDQTYRDRVNVNNVSMIPYSITQGACFNTMADAKAFTDNPLNACTNATTSATCFKQLMVNPSSPSSTVNTLRCPVGYDALLSFGDEIVSNGDPDRKLVYTNDDTRSQVTQDQYNFYKSKGYTCGPDYSYNYGQGYKDPAIRAYGSAKNGSNPAVKPGRPYNTEVGYWYNKNGAPMRVEYANYNSYQCRTSGDVNADDWVCGSPGIAGAYWTQDWFPVFFPQVCKRAAGFYDAVANPPYQLPSASTVYSPTIVICGKAQTGWAREGATPRPSCSSN